MKKIYINYMNTIIIIVALIIFIFKRESIILGSTYALNIWCKNIFPILFPTFILSDAFISSKFLNKIICKFGFYFGKLFKTSKYSLYIFLISMLSGTPTNAKNLCLLYNNNLIKKESITKILSFSYLFNPFFIISFSNIKVLIILWLSNLITGLFLRNYYIEETNNNIDNFSFNFNLIDSINNNMNIIINILGTVTIFMIISFSIPFINEYINVILTSILELTSGLYKIKLYFNIDYLYLFALSLGSLSILMQIKSIIKDTFIDYKFIIKSRIICLIISLLLCYIF